MTEVWWRSVSGSFLFLTSDELGFNPPVPEVGLGATSPNEHRSGPHGHNEGMYNPSNMPPRQRELFARLSQGQKPNTHMGPDGQEMGRGKCGPETG